MRLRSTITTVDCTTPGCSAPTGSSERRSSQRRGKKYKTSRTRKETARRQALGGSLAHPGQPQDGTDQRIGLAPAKGSAAAPAMGPWGQPRLDARSRPGGLP